MADELNHTPSNLSLKQKTEICIMHSAILFVGMCVFQRWSKRYVILNTDICLFCPGLGFFKRKD